MGRVAVAVGMCVCMCVVGVRVEKEATGLGREGERETYRSEADGMLTIQQIVPATGSEGREQREESWGPVRRTEGRAASLPLVPGQIYSDCHVIVPVRWQCVRLDCVCLVDIVESCWEAVKEV